MITRKQVKAELRKLGLVGEKFKIKDVLSSQRIKRLQDLLRQ